MTISKFDMKRITIRLSDENGVNKIANQVAAEMERKLGVDGSTIYKTEGRWKNNSEPGRVIELVVPGDRQFSAGALKLILDEFELTAFVTVETGIVGVEVF